MTVRPSGSTRVSESFQASRRSSASSISGVGWLVWKVPIIETPVLWRLKPATWAPTTPRQMPP